MMLCDNHRISCKPQSQKWWRNRPTDKYQEVKIPCFVKPILSRAIKQFNFFILKIYHCTSYYELRHQQLQCVCVCCVSVCVYVGLCMCVCVHVLLCVCMRMCVSVGCSLERAVTVNTQELWWLVSLSGRVGRQVGNKNWTPP